MTYDGILDTDSPVSIKGPAGTMNAQGMHLMDKGNNINFKKKSTAHINTKNGKVVVTARDGININRTLRTMTAQKKVRITYEEKVLTADHVVLYYTDERKMRIDHIEATGHVITTDKENKITADKMIAYYNNDDDNLLRSIKASGRVNASNPKNVITGDSGEYSPTKQTITMFGNVVLRQGESFMKGSEAWLNMATGESNLKNEQITNTGKQKGRVTGTFMPQEWIKN